MFVGPSPVMQRGAALPAALLEGSTTSVPAMSQGGHLGKTQSPLGTTR